MESKGNDVPPMVLTSDTLNVRHGVLSSLDPKAVEVSIRGPQEVSLRQDRVAWGGLSIMYSLALHPLNRISYSFGFYQCRNSVFSTFAAAIGRFARHPPAPAIRG